MTTNNRPFSMAENSQNDMKIILCWSTSFNHLQPEACSFLRRFKDHCKKWFHIPNMNPTKSWRVVDLNALTTQYSASPDESATMMADIFAVTVPLNRQPPTYRLVILLTSVNFMFLFNVQFGFGFVRKKIHSSSHWKKAF